MKEGTPIECRDCGRLLAELLLLKTRPLTDPWGKPTSESVRCRCPFCGGKSAPVELFNRYHLSPAVSIPDPTAPGEYVELTRVGDCVRDSAVSTAVEYVILPAQE